DLRGLKLRNRIVMAPMTRSRAPSTVPDALTAEYYGQRAGAGLIIGEGAQVSEQARGYLFTPGLHTAAQVQGWKGVTAAVHARGGAIFAQLWHVGRVAHCSVQPFDRAPVAPVAVAAAGVNAYGYREDGTPARCRPARRARSRPTRFRRSRPPSWLRPATRSRPALTAWRSTAPTGTCSSSSSTAA